MPVPRSDFFSIALSNKVTIKLGTSVAAVHRADKRDLARFRTEYP